MNNLPPRVAAAVQHWWNTDPQAIHMVRENMTLSLSLTAAKVALAAMKESTDAK